MAKILFLQSKVDNSKLAEDINKLSKALSNEDAIYAPVFFFDDILDEDASFSLSHQENIEIMEGIYDKLDNIDNVVLFSVLIPGFNSTYITSILDFYATFKPHMFEESDFILTDMEKYSLQDVDSAFIMSESTDFRDFGLNKIKEDKADKIIYKFNDNSYGLLFKHAKIVDVYQTYCYSKDMDYVPIAEMLFKPIRDCLNLYMIYTMAATTDMCVCIKEINDV